MGRRQEKAPPGYENVVQALKDKYPDDPSRAFAIAWGMANKGITPKSEAGMAYAPDALLRRYQFECKHTESASIAALGQLARPGAKPAREGWVTLPDGRHVLIGDEKDTGKSPAADSHDAAKKQPASTNKLSMRTNDIVTLKHPATGKRIQATVADAKYHPDTKTMTYRWKPWGGSTPGFYTHGIPKSATIAARAKRIPERESSEARRESARSIARSNLRWFAPLREAEQPNAPDGTPRIALITAGPGNHKDGNFYPPEVIQRDFKVFDGTKCFLDHPGILDEQNRPEREVESIAGWFTNVAATKLDKTVGVVADFRYLAELSNELTDGGRKAKGLIESAIRYQRDYPAFDKVLVGFSINAEGPSESMPTDEMIQRWPEFREALSARDEWNVVQAIEHAMSVDLVTFPARGGRVLGLREAEALMDSSVWRKQFTAVLGVRA